MPTTVKAFAKGLGVFLLYLVVVNVAVRPTARLVTTKMGVPQLGNMI
jgi:hypothetical protein